MKNKMKLTLGLLAAAGAFFLTSCGSSPDATQTTGPGPYIGPGSGSVIVEK